MTVRDEIKKAFSDSLLAERRKASETLESLANKSNLGIRYVQDLEAGKKLPSILTLLKLCDALNISPNDLLQPAQTKYKKLK